MYKEFAESMRGLPRGDNLYKERLIRESLTAFNGMINFLRSGDCFPNREINKLMTLSWRLIDNEVTPLAIDLQNDFQNQFLMATRDQKGQLHTTYCLPRYFLSAVRYDLVSELGTMVYTGSQMRDNYMGRMQDGNQIVAARATAFEADMLLTLANMAQAENHSLKFSDHQQDVLKLYPHGILSLPRNYNYQTPNYTGIISPN